MRATLLLVMLSSAFGETKLPPSANRKIDFEKDVQPVLSQKCHSCHGEDVQQSGLRLDKRQNALRGGDYGPVIIPGKSAESKLIRRLVNGDGGLQMPPTGPLSDEEIGILRARRKGPGAGGPGNRKRYLVLSLCMVRRRVASEKPRKTSWSALMYTAFGGVSDSGP